MSWNERHPRPLEISPVTAIFSCDPTQRKWNALRVITNEFKHAVTFFAKGLQGYIPLCFHHYVSFCGKASGYFQLISECKDTILVELEIPANSKF